MQPVGMSCPNCGAGLGAASASGEYVCAYCNHVARVPVAPPRAAAVSEQIAAMMAANGARREQALAQRDEVKQRLYAEEAAGTRTGAIFVLVLGGAGVVGALVLAATEGAFLGAAIMGLVSGLFIALGVYNLRYGAWVQRMRATGVPGRATVLAYKARGSASFDLTLRIELGGQAPYEVVKKRVYTGVAGSVRVATGAELPVLVAPENPGDVMVTWI